MTELRLEDDRAAADFATFVGRALRVNPDGALRLQAAGEVLACWFEVLPGRGLRHSGLALALRVQRLAAPAALDTAVALVALRDRIAHGITDTIPVPPQEVPAPWLAISPPRSGWEPAATVTVERLREAARMGVLEVADGTPDGAGAAAVAALRQRVWSRPVDEVVPAGAAFAADALGFLVGEAAQVHRVGPWTRLSTPAGYVITR